MKIHLFVSPEPPQYGENLKATCGASVPAAQPIRYDDDSDFPPAKTTLFCRRCQEALGKITYVSWIISGEESKQIEGSAK